MRLTLPRILAAVIVVLLIVGGVVLLTNPGQYKVSVFLPSGNPNIIPGAPILFDGFELGTVDDIVPEGSGAAVTLNVDDQVAPLHQGAKAFVQWSAVVGERQINVIDGPRSNPEVPDGGRLEGDMPRPMEVSDVLRSLDPATRARLGPLAQGLQASLKGSEQDLNSTLRTAGPAVTAIGNVFKGLATDGPALNKLVNDTNALVARIAARRGDLSGVVNDLTTTTRDTAAVRVQLREVLQKLPPVLDQATLTLGRVPGTVDATVPLLDDARKATDRLPSVANNLEPLLRDLRPTIGELKPTLEALSELLKYTPGLLDSAKTTVPKLSETFEKIEPTLKDVKPFSPCVVGLLSTFAANSPFNNGRGQAVRVPVKIGPASVAEVPAPLPPGLNLQRTRRDCPSPFAAGEEKRRGLEAKNLFPADPNLRADGKPLQTPQQAGLPAASLVSNPVAALTGPGGLN